MPLQLPAWEASAILGQVLCTHVPRSNVYGSRDLTYKAVLVNSEWRRILWPH